VIGGFYIGKCYCSSTITLYALDNLAVFNLADFHNSPNHQNKFYAKFSSCTVFTGLEIMSGNHKLSGHDLTCQNKYMACGM